MIPVHGYACKQAKGPLTSYAFERREPRDHDVVIDIQYCGICHSDIHQVSDEWGGSAFPMIPGHEIAGIVSQVGTNVGHYNVGERVGVGCFVDSCRKCSSCYDGLEQYCIEGCTLTYNGVERDGKTPTQGGYSNKIVVNENYVLRILMTFLFLAPLLSCVQGSHFILLSCIGMPALGREWLSLVWVA